MHGLAIKWLSGFWYHGGICVMERGSDKDAFTKKTTLCERKVGALCGERLTQASLGERVGPLGRDGAQMGDEALSKRGGADLSWPGGEPAWEAFSGRRKSLLHIVIWKIYGATFYQGVRGGGESSWLWWKGGNLRGPLGFSSLRRKSLETAAGDCDATLETIWRRFHLRAAEDFSCLWLQR